MFLIIHDDKPIYELVFLTMEKQPVKEYFLVHASLDSVDFLMKSKKDYFLGLIKVDDQLVYAYINSVSKALLILRCKIASHFEKGSRQGHIETDQIVPCQDQLGACPGLPESALQGAWSVEI